MNVKPGDLAITVCNNDDPIGLRNSGRIVEVLRFFGPYRYAGGHVGLKTWRVKLLGSPMRAKTRTYAGEVFIDDENLRPIRGDSVDDEEVSSLYQSNPTKETA